MRQLVGFCIANLYLDTGFLQTDYSQVNSLVSDEFPVGHQWELSSRHRFLKGGDSIVNLLIISRYSYSIFSPRQVGEIIRDYQIGVTYFYFSLMKFLSGVVKKRYFRFTHSFS